MFYTRRLLTIFQKIYRGEDQFLSYQAIFKLWNLKFTLVAKIMGHRPAPCTLRHAFKYVVLLNFVFPLRDPYIYQCFDLNVFCKVNINVQAKEIER